MTPTTGSSGKLSPEPKPTCPSLQFGHPHTEQPRATVGSTDQAAVRTAHLQQTGRERHPRLGAADEDRTGRGIAAREVVVTEDLGVRLQGQEVVHAVMAGVGQRIHAPHRC